VVVAGVVVVAAAARALDVGGEPAAVRARTVASMCLAPARRVAKVTRSKRV